MYWFSCDLEKMTVTLDMSEVLEMLDPQQIYKLFTVVGKAANEPLAVVSEEEGL